MSTFQNLFRDSFKSETFRVTNHVIISQNRESGVELVILHLSSPAGYSHVYTKLILKIWPKYIASSKSKGAQVDSFHQRKEHQDGSQDFFYSTTYGICTRISISINQINAHLVPPTPSMANILKVPHQSLNLWQTSYPHLSNTPHNPLA